MSIVLIRILVTPNRALSRLVPIACVVAACLAIASPAEAYLDPGTGSMLLSAIIGVAAAVGLAVKMFWYRLVGLVRGKPRGSRPGAVDGAPSADE
jgi:4-amino-4-deoxy-L-arabinose transferase-like glycosyltransferase